MARRLSTRRIVIGLIGVLIAINVVIAGTGNMHAGRRHPVWVNALSWLFAAILWPLIAWGVLTVVRRVRRHRPHREPG